MDGIGWGEAPTTTARGRRWSSELARVLNAPMCGQSGRSIRSLEQRGNGPQRRPRPTFAQRAALQGKEDPPIRRYPDPSGWLIQHDMMLFDHGMPRADARSARSSGPKRTSISNSQSTRSLRISHEAGFLFPGRQREIRHRLSAASAPHDQYRLHAFMDLVPAISVRENERGSRLAPDGIPIGTSRRIGTRRSPTRISPWLTRRRHRWQRSPSWRGGAEEMTAWDRPKTA